MLVVLDLTEEQLEDLKDILRVGLMPLTADDNPEFSRNMQLMLDQISKQDFPDTRK